jgi:hypothetical protein
MQQLRYMGFDQARNTRAYRFDVIGEGDVRHFVISADLALFLKHRVGIQEGPALCMHKLAADIEALREGVHELTGDDLQAYIAARTAALERKASARKHSAS